MTFLKLFLFLVTLNLSTHTFAKDFKLRCVVHFNSENLLDTEVMLPSGARGKHVGEVEGFSFFLTQTGEETVELQAYNGGEESRYYALAKLNTPTSFVEFSSWKREFILEARCTVI